MQQKLNLPKRQPTPPKPPPVEEDVDHPELEGSRMTLWDHLDELRQRLTKAILSLVFGTIVGVFFATPVLEFLQQPYGRPFTTLGPTSGVVEYFRVSLLMGGIIAIPIMTYQILMFIVPGLTNKERRILLYSIPPITLLFLVGVAFAWFLLIPPALGFLESFQPTLFKPEWTPELYLSFVTSLLFWMGVAFETPLIFFVLSLIGFVTPGALIRNWRIAVVGSSVAAALITPTVDPVNMSLVMVPLLVLYALSIVLTTFGIRFNRAQET